METTNFVLICLIILYIAYYNWFKLWYYIQWNHPDSYHYIILWKYHYKVYDRADGYSAKAILHLFRKKPTEE